MFRRGRLALFLLPSRLQLRASAFAAMVAPAALPLATALAVIAPGWKEKLDPVSGKTFYYNRTTKETTWDFPSDTDVKAVVRGEKEQSTAASKSALPAAMIAPDWKGKIDAETGKASSSSSTKKQPTRERKNAIAPSAFCGVHKQLRSKEFLLPNNDDASTFSCIARSQCKTTVCAVHGNIRLLRLLSALPDGQGWECLPDDQCKVGGTIADDAHKINNQLTVKELCSEHKMLRFRYAMVANSDGTSWRCQLGNVCKEKRTVYCSTHKKYRKSVFMMPTGIGEFVCVAPNECVDAMRNWVPDNVLPPDWKKKIDPDSGNTFYYNRKTKETTWDFPAAAPAVTAVVSVSTLVSIAPKPSITDTKPAVIKPAADKAAADKATAEKATAHKATADPKPLAVITPVKLAVKSVPTTYSDDDEDFTPVKPETVAPHMVIGQPFVPVSPLKPFVPKPVAKISYNAAIEDDDNDDFVPTEGAVTPRQPYVPTVIAPDWKAKLDAETGNTFYFNRKTKETTWDFPAGPADK